MTLKDTPIQRKLMIIILLTSVVVMLLMGGTFFTYEFLAFRQTTIRQLTTLGEITAANSTAALAFDNQQDAGEILAALRADKHIDAACLYDQHGRLFSKYPENLAAESFPFAPGTGGYRFDGSYLAGFQPVVQSGNKRLGTLYLRFDASAIIVNWLKVSVGVGAIVMALVLLVAYVLSRALQKQISRPILTLAETAHAISDRGDYSVRATKLGRDELGLLTDAFNQMLAQIQGQNQALKDSEERFRMMFENNPAPMWVYDLETLAFLAVNHAAIHHYGYSRKEFLGMTIKDIRPPEDIPLLEKNLPNPPTRDAEAWRHRKKDGTVIKVEVASGELAFDGRRVRLVLTNDVTARLHAEQEIRRLNDELEQRVIERTGELEAAYRELEAFSYSVSHDLRAPLRHVDGFAGLLAKHAVATLDEKGRRYLTTISDSAKRMGRLIDDLLVFSRMSRSPMSATAVDHAALVAAILRESNYEKTGPITWNIAALPQGCGDAAMLRQVWVNLIDNAVKYSGKSPNPCVTVGVMPSDGTDSQTFFVRDNGVGFDMNYVDKLFGVFQRLHGPAEFEGTGIGLANVRRIVSRHGGRTWAEGRVGEGATFYFSLPSQIAPTLPSPTTKPR